MSSKYTLNTSLLVQRLLPSFMAAGPKILAWLRTLLAPIGVINDEFNNLIDATTFNLSATGQVAVLEAALNIRYKVDPNKIGIKILETNISKPYWFGFFKSENKDPLGYGYFASAHKAPLGIGYFLAEYDLEIDYYVVVPAYVGYSEQKLKEVLAFADNYKLAQMRTAIITI